METREFLRSSLLSATEMFLLMRIENWDGDLSLSDDNFTYFRKWKKKKWSWASYLDLNLHLRARYVKF